MTSYDEILLYLFAWIGTSILVCTSFELFKKQKKIVLFLKKHKWIMFVIIILPIGLILPFPFNVIYTCFQIVMLLTFIKLKNFKE